MSSDADISERALRARIAAHESWAQTTDRTDRTNAARQAFRDRFEREADPDGVLSPEERAKQAENKRKAFYTRLAYKSVASRRKAAESRAAAQSYESEADQADAELSDAGGDAA